MSDAERLLTGALAALDALAVAGDANARHAAAVLRGTRRSGRPPIDDSAALAEMDRLAAAGRGREAANIVARRLSEDPAEQAAIAQRLRGKRKMKCRE
jgi:hypothetical protein